MAIKPTIRAIQTPGEPIQPEETNEVPKPDAFTARVVTTGADDPAGASWFTLATKADDPVDEMDEMAQMRAQMAAMMQQNAALQAAVDNLARGVQAAVDNLARGVQASRTVAAELPDASDFDPAKITAPVLTKDGWLVPQTYGSNPAISRQ